MLAATWAMWAICSCGERPPGSTCLASTECSTGLCYANRCLDPLSDDDGDGVINGTEYELGSHPLLVDTDGDGKPDGAEVGEDAAHPLDRDGDGKPDVIESLFADADRDCLTDEKDPDDATANQDPQVLASDSCNNSGVCAGQHALIVATCNVGVGTLKCDNSAVPGWSEGEICDGKDNDCDGQVDEGHTYQGAAVGASCAGAGTCGPGVVECVQGKAACSTNPGGSEVGALSEQCNGQDDDCDGKTDEGFVLAGLHVGAPCYGTGECGVGVVVCGTTGVPLCSSDPGGPAARNKSEICDGKDNDCDGQSDEELNLGGLLLGDHCTAGGVCGQGLVVCAADGQAVCSSGPDGPDSKAMAEECNGKDDNCDGLTDEGFTYGGGTLGAVCTGIGACGVGTVVCATSGIATCSTLPDAVGAAPLVETCDGQDDDCDGLTDEDFVFQGRILGQSCEGIGVCGVGTVECTVAGAVTCSTNPDGSKPQGNTETCNKLDDDCNGLIDDAIVADKAPACTPKGVCLGAQPLSVCVSGVWACDYPQLAGFQGPAETSCDGKDNDCDGLTDEGLGHVWQQEELASDGHPAARLGAASYTAFDAIVVAGGTAGSLAGKPSAAPELWRFDLLKKRWQLLMQHAELARTGATLVEWPPGLVGPEPALWLIGGDKGGASAQGAVSLNPSTGQAIQLAFKQPPQHRKGAVAVVDGKSKRLFLVGGPTNGVGTGVQVFDLAQNTWLSDKQVPQPGQLGGPAASCMSGDGSLWLFGHGPQSAPVFARLPAGKSEWQMLPSSPGGEPVTAAKGGRLTCEPVAGQIWLVGFAAGGGSSGGGLRRYQINSKQWLSDEPGSFPAGISPVVAMVSLGVLVAGLGHDDAGVPDHRMWVGKTGDWQRLRGGLPAVVGGRLAGDSKTAWRVGGALINGDKANLDVAVWQRSGGAWSPLPSDPDLPTRMYANVLHDQAGKRLLIWGGLTKATALSDLVSTVVETAAPGGEQIDLKTGKTSALSAAQMSGLPSLAVDASVAPGATATDAWVFGIAPVQSKVQLWRVDMKSPLSKELVWSQSAGQPTFQRGSVLVWDPVLARLLLLTINGSLQVWAWDPTPGGGWAKLKGEDPSVPQGRLRLFGDPTLADSLVMITYPMGGKKAEIRLAKFSGAAKLGAWPGQVPSWWGPVDSLWMPAEGRVLISPGTDAQGLLQPGIWDWHRVCAKP